jgi:hypothetical protein
VTDYRVTQAAVEEWAAIVPPQMQATQVAIEHWGAVTTAATLRAVTQVAVEQWVPATPSQTAVTTGLQRPVVTVASGGLAVIEVPVGLGIAVSESVNGYGLAVTKVAKYGLPVTYVS